MRLIQILILAAIALTLAACNSDEDTNDNAGSAGDNAPKNTQTTTDHAAKDKSEVEVGFEMAGGNIEKAQNVPEKDKTALIASFDKYIDAFNKEDIDQYMSVISKNPKGFNYDDEKVVVEDTFAEYDTIRTAEDVTVIEYDKTEAQVFATIHIELEHPTSGAKLDRDGRQVTVFVKEGGEWLVTSVYFIGETAE